MINEDNLIKLIESPSVDDAVLGIGIVKNNVTKIKASLLFAIMLYTSFKQIYDWHMLCEELTIDAQEFYEFKRFNRGDGWSCNKGKHIHKYIKQGEEILPIKELIPILETHFSHKIDFIKKVLNLS